MKIYAEKNEREMAKSRLQTRNESDAVCERIRKIESEIRNIKPHRSHLSFLFCVYGNASFYAAYTLDWPQSRPIH